MSDIAYTAPSAATDPTAPLGTVTRCVSILLSHLSLSLSLSCRVWQAASRPLRGIGCLFAQQTDRAVRRGIRRSRDGALAPELSPRSARAGRLSPWWDKRKGMGGVMIGFRVQRLRAAAAMVVAAVGVSLMCAGGASAFTEPGLTNNFPDFVNCPLSVQSLSFCLHAYVEGGVVQIGHATVPISVPGDTIDMGVEESREELSGGPGQVLSGPHGILNGPAQPVPGGLLGSLGNVRLGAVSAKLEWAVPVLPRTVFGTDAALPEILGGDPNAILNEEDVVGRRGTGLVLIARIHLLNPFLGPNCYIGSAGSPVTIRLTTGPTSPPPPNTSISGRHALLVSNTDGSIVHLQGGIYVDNAFPVPGATGCGTSGTGGLLNGAIDQKVGLPSAAGHNSITLYATADQAAKSVIEEHNIVEG
jgi:hypothetical protein